MNEVRDPLTTEQRKTFEELQRRATSLNCDLWYEVVAKNAGVEYVVSGPGGMRRLASLVAVSATLRDFE